MGCTRRESHAIHSYINVLTFLALRHSISQCFAWPRAKWSEKRNTKILPGSHGLFVAFCCCLPFVIDAVEKIRIIVNDQMTDEH